SQTRGTLQNLKTVLECAGTNMQNVVKTTIYLTNLADFEIVNQIYSEFFPEEPPARSCVQVVAIAHGALIEIEAIATIG
ncbi:MAG TPA: Rid family hydrolase, partial [Anaerolineaceae bacterium]|nr:Rid family hydrolase [Anaerolineaceae bacterium]